MVSSPVGIYKNTAVFQNKDYTQQIVAIVAVGIGQCVVMHQSNAQKYSKAVTSTTHWTHNATIKSISPSLEAQLIKNKQTDNYI